MDRAVPTGGPPRSRPGAPARSASYVIPPRMTHGSVRRATFSHPFGSAITCAETLGPLRAGMQPHDTVRVLHTRAPPSSSALVMVLAVAASYLAAAHPVPRLARLAPTRRQGEAVVLAVRMGRVQIMGPSREDYRLLMRHHPAYWRSPIGNRSEVTMALTRLVPPGSCPPMLSLGRSICRHSDLS